MRIALIGTGKTGGEVLKLLAPNELQATYNSRNCPQAQDLAAADVCIVFTPGDAFLELIPTLLESRRPVVCGSSGWTMPPNLSDEVRARGISWILSSNFSIGMNICFSLTKYLAGAAKALDGAQLSLREIHHIHKKDAPSATALKLKKLLGQEIEIHSEREGDVKGFHELTVRTKSEEIKLSHDVFDRRVFAEGAIWAAKNLAYQNQVGPGLHCFEDCIEKLIRRGL